MFADMASLGAVTQSCGPILSWAALGAGWEIQKVMDDRG